MATKTNPARARSETSEAPQRLIDVHHHIIPPFYIAENRDRIAGSRGGQITPAWLEWTPEKALIAMDQHHVATAVLSLSSPGVWFGDVQVARDRLQQHVGKDRDRRPSLNDSLGKIQPL